MPLSNTTPERRPPSIATSTPPAPIREVQVKKVVLAYSGGLDTSVAVAWLREQYDAEVITLTVDVGYQVCTDVECFLPQQRRLVVAVPLRRLDHPAPRP